jgi:hypothetical protein
MKKSRILIRHTNFLSPKLPIAVPALIICFSLCSAVASSPTAGHLTKILETLTQLLTSSATAPAAKERRLSGAFKGTVS